MDGIVAVRLSRLGALCNAYDAAVDNGATFSSFSTIEAILDKLYYYYIGAKSSI